MRLEALLATGAYQHVRAEAARQMEVDGVEAGEQAKLLRMACRASLGLQDYYAAARFGERAVEQAREVGDRLTLGQALYELGHAYLHIGESAGAQQQLEAFLALLVDVPVLADLKGKALFNLAHAHRKQRDWISAVAMLEQAATWFDRAGQAGPRAQVDLDLAWCYIMMGTPALADPHIARLEAHLQVTDDAGLACDLVSMQALRTRAGHELATSSRLCRELLDPGRPGVTDHHRAEACWILGENALDVGSLEEAGTFVNLAIEYAARDNWPTMMNLAGDLRRRYQERATAGV